MSNITQGPCTNLLSEPDESHSPGSPPSRHRQVQVFNRTTLQEIKPREISQWSVSDHDCDGNTRGQKDAKVTQVGLTERGNKRALTQRGPKMPYSVMSPQGQMRMLRELRDIRCHCRLATTTNDVQAIHACTSANETEMAVNHSPLQTSP